MKSRNFLLFLSASLLFPLSASPEGAFTTLHVKAMDIAKYVDYFSYNQHMH